jgi:hypothetical protein
MTEEENAQICQAQVRDFFAKKNPPPEEKIDPVKLKRTVKNLKRPPPPPLDDNHLRALKKAVQGARQSGSTSSDKRLQERRSANKIPQLGEEANHSCPPLKVSSDIIANLPGMLPGTNPADYLSDDIEFETMEVDEFRYEYGKPLGTRDARFLPRFGPSWQR